MPKGKDQARIAEFLSLIDEEIECELSQIEHWNTFKSGLLQQMFR
jgi:restriction endonuclease S subunit